MVSLSKIAKFYGTDKGPSKHNYTCTYEKLFSSIRMSYISMLEIGVASGASVKMWLDYFRYGMIYGLDVIDFNTRMINSERFTFIRGSQSHKGVLENILHNCSHFDIIIDDGSHLPWDQQYTFLNLFQTLKPGGLYIIEDLDYKVRQPRKGIDKTSVWIHNYLKTGKLTGASDKFVSRNIASVNFYRSDKMVVIKKAGSSKPRKSVEKVEQEIKEEVGGWKDIGIDFTTTATVRPEIVNETYKSFKKNLKGVDFAKSTLYINIDPVPEGQDPKSIVKVAKKYFGKVVHNIPNTPSYSQAFNWIWSKATTDLIVNLEDDWYLDKPIHIKELIDIFKNKPTLYMVVLRAYSYVYPALVTSPAIVHKRLYKKVAGKLDPTINPENQLHTKGRVFGLDMPFKQNGIDPAKRIVAYPENLDDIIVKDLGREWMEKQIFRRPDKKSKFVTWIHK